MINMASGNVDLLSYIMSMGGLTLRHYRRCVEAEEELDMVEEEQHIVAVTSVAMFIVTQ